MKQVILIQNWLRKGEAFFDFLKKPNALYESFGKPNKLVMNAQKWNFFLLLVTLLFTLHSLQCHKKTYFQINHFCFNVLLQRIVPWFPHLEIFLWRMPIWKWLSLRLTLIFFRKYSLKISHLGIPNRCLNWGCYTISWVLDWTIANFYPWNEIFIGRKCDNPKKNCHFVDFQVHNSLKPTAWLLPLKSTSFFNGRKGFFV